MNWIRGESEGDSASGLKRRAEFNFCCRYHDKFKLWAPIFLCPPMHPEFEMFSMPLNWLPTFGGFGPCSDVDALFAGARRSGWQRRRSVGGVSDSDSQTFQVFVGRHRSLVPMAMGASCRAANESCESYAAGKM